MSKQRIGQIVVLLLLVILFLAPVYESFDHWDRFPQGGDDTVLSLLAVVTFCGVVLVAGRSLFQAFFRKCLPRRGRSTPRRSFSTFPFPKKADESPPLAFRFSLRV